MKTIYYPQDDILEIRLSDKPVAREVSQDWNVNVSYAEDGTVVELMVRGTWFVDRGTWIQQRATNNEQRMQSASMAR